MGVKINIEPEEIIVVPAKYEVKFHEDRDHGEFMVEPEPYQDELRDDLKAWLDAHAPGWTVEFDRGDWGEGPASVTISFPSEAAARAFHAAWNGDRCVDVGYGNCAHMRKIDDRTYRCSHCGKELKVRRLLPDEGQDP